VRCRSTRTWVDEAMEIGPDPDYCSVPDFDLDAVLAGRTVEGVPQDPYERLVDIFYLGVGLILPFAGPGLAFVLWEYILQAVHFVLGDENRLLELTQLTLTPTTNGIVVSSLATALGTLVSVTVWTLRSRQLDIKSTVNKEASELSMLHLSLSMSLTPAGENPNVPAAVMYAEVIALLRQYCARVASECSASANLRTLERQDVGNTELRGIMRVLQACGPSRLSDQVTSTVSRLNDLRSGRLATLSTGFPPIHWVILALLASSIALCFLIEVDQSEGRFLSERPEDSLRLRLVFTILVGTFSGLTSLCFDLNDPFRGSFRISGSTDQLYNMVETMDQEIKYFSRIEKSPLTTIPPSLRPKLLAPVKARHSKPESSD